MYYTRTGDDGTTTICGCDQRLSKSSAIMEALGALDEATSTIGLCGAVAGDMTLPDGTKACDVLRNVQEHLFTIQAQVAGADNVLSETTVVTLEEREEMIARTISLIRSFIIPGGSELSARVDVARTVARRAERRVVAVAEEAVADIAPETLRYLNRLSSFLFVLARYVNVQEGVVEHAPKYDK
jgi:cob(I)alamin adenosyltransferase